MRPHRNSAYDARASFGTRTREHNTAPSLKLKPSPGIPDEDGHGMFMDETQERSYGLNHSLMREVGQRGVHSNIDALPIRSMSDGVYAARPDRGTTYCLDWQLQPAYPFHPLSTMAYQAKPKEDRGNVNPVQTPFFISNYG